MDFADNQIIVQCNVYKIIYLYNFDQTSTKGIHFSFRDEKSLDWYISVSLGLYVIFVVGKQAAYFVRGGS